MHGVLVLIPTFLSRNTAYSPNSQSSLCGDATKLRGRIIVSVWSLSKELPVHKHAFPQEDPMDGKVSKTAYCRRPGNTVYPEEAGQDRS